MNRTWWPVFLALAGCASDGPKVVDGGVVDANGWPVRNAELRLRCPEGTYLDDLFLADGRREVTCRRMGLPRPMGFQLQWAPDGTLVTQAEMNADGVPVVRQRWYDDGRPKSREAFENGEVQVREVWYPTGVLQERSQRADRLLNVMRYQPDGQVEAEGALDGDTRVGTWTIFRDSATESVGYINGVEEGPATRTYLDGTIETGKYVAGKKTGVWLRATQQNVPVREETYANGVLEGAWQSYHPNQSLAVKGRYRAGEKHGTWTSYHPNGQMKSRGNYGCDKEQGLWEYWHANGRLSQTGHYTDALKVGEWNHYGEDGTLLKVDTHQGVESQCGETP